MYYRYNDIKNLKSIETPYNFIKKLDIFLIRHGESEGNILQKKVIDTQIDVKPEERIDDIRIKLTKNGEDQAKEVGKKLNKIIEDKKIDKSKILVLVSPYERSRSTFEIANKELKLDMKNIFVLNSLREQSFGAFDFINHQKKLNTYGREYAEYTRNSLKFFRQQYLGESPAEVYDRSNSILFFIKEYVEHNSVENIFIFGHGCINRILLMNFLNLPPEFYDNYDLPENASIIKIEKGKWNF